MNQKEVDEKVAAAQKLVEMAEQELTRTRMRNSIMGHCGPEGAVQAGVAEEVPTAHDFYLERIADELRELNCRAALSQASANLEVWLHESARTHE